MQRRAPRSTAWPPPGSATFKDERPKPPLHVPHATTHFLSAGSLFQAPLAPLVLQVRDPIMYLWEPHLPVTQIKRHPKCPWDAFSLPSFQSNCSHSQFFLVVVRAAPGFVFCLDKELVPNVGTRNYLGRNSSIRHRGSIINIWAGNATRSFLQRSKV